MKKFNKKQLASWINKAVEESSSAYIPFPIADHIAEQLCLYFEEEDLWDEISPEDVMQEVESALGVSEAYNEYLGSKGLDMVDDEEWEDYIVRFMELIDNYENE
jgi:hypothetical protein|nr:MAG TPA: hypothetical protein [Caudoviricetes sp.]